MNRVINNELSIRPSKGKNIKKDECFKIINSILLFLFGVLMIVPFVFMISTALKTPGEFVSNPVGLIPKHMYLGNFKEVLANKLFFTWYGNSIKIVIVVLLLRIIVICCAAYAFAILKFPFKNFLFALVMATMFIPGDTTIVSRYFIYKYMHLTDTTLAIIIPGIADTLMFFMMRQFFMKIPYELIESAFIDGCSYIKILYKIIMPLAKPAITTLVLFSFIWVWNDFTGPSLFINNPQKQTLTVGILNLTDSHGNPLTNVQLAGALFAVIPVSILFMVTQRFFIEGVAHTGIKG